MRVVLVRLSDNGEQTIGSLYVFNSEDEVMFSCYIMEPPWKDNKRNVSCIPAGTYTVNRRENARFGKHWILRRVPGRSYILIHVGNYNKSTRGCLLPGADLVDLNNDGLQDVVDSRITLDRLNEILPEEWEIEIVNLI